MSNQIFYKSGDKNFHLNENSGILVLNKIIPTVNGRGILCSGEPSIVYTYGTQSINGTKTFTSRPKVNGSGVLLSGEATIVYTTGNQTISGIKTFANIHATNLTSNITTALAPLQDRRPLPYPVLSETLFTGLRAEKRVHTRSYNSIDNSWATETIVIQLPLISDTYYNAEVIWDQSESDSPPYDPVWGAETSPVAFGTSNSYGLIFENDDEGAKVMRLGTKVIPALPNPAPASPYTTNAIFTESFSMTLAKKNGDWYSSAFATNWDSASPSKNIFIMNGTNQNELLDVWRQESWESEIGQNYLAYQAEMGSTNILLRCSKRYTSWSNGVSPSVEGNGNIIVEIIFYGIPTLGFGATTGTFCEGNDSRIANIQSSSINTKDATTIGYGFGIGGSINTSGKAKNENAGSPTPAGGNINTSAGNLSEDGWTGGAGGSINTGGENGQTVQTRHGRNGGSIDTSAGGGAISTRGVGSIQLGVTGTRTTLNGSANTTDKIITLPNVTGTLPIALISAVTALNFGSIGTFGFVDLTIALTGAATTDVVFVTCLNGRGAIDGKLIFEAFVSATNTVTVRAHNPTSGAIDPAPYDFKVAIIKIA